MKKKPFIKFILDEEIVHDSLWTFHEEQEMEK